MKIAIPSIIMRVLSCLPLSPSCYSQTDSAAIAARQAEDRTAFDFWMGDWSLEWTENESITATGENRIEKSFDGFVISENFRALTGSQAGYIGASWSVYNPRTFEWKQTWVDNQGSYLDFTCDISGDNRIFKRTITRNDGSLIQQRMVFRDRQKDSFVWDWESSVDSGKTWKANWQILYSRKK
jgi:hypothetical protein